MIENDVVTAITDIAQVAYQYNHLGADLEVISNVRGVVLNPMDWETLNEKGQIHRTANKADKVGDRLLGLTLTKSPGVQVGHAMWIGVHFKALAYTNSNGIVDEKKDADDATDQS